MINSKKVLLIDVDKKYPNLALMKLSAYHKAKGDQVLLNFGIGEYDKVYASCIFTKNAHKLKEYTYNMEAGGAGVDLQKTLPKEIEYICPDYSLYNIDYGLGFITRGCIRKCKWCIVPQKEGRIKFWQEPDKFKNPLSNKMVFLDANFLAHSLHKEFLQKIIDKKWQIDFNQGLDIRLVDEENANLLAQIKWLKQIRFAFDTMAMEKAIFRGVKILKKTGIKPSKLMFYMLIGFNTSFQEDMYRFQRLLSLGVTPFVMCYEEEKQPRIKKEFARWGRMPRFGRTCSFEEFLKYRKVSYLTKMLF